MTYLVDCFRYTNGFLKEIGVKYWLDFASLLGLYRDQRIIPWDKDVDFSIMVEDAPRILEHYEKIRKAGYHPMYRSHKEIYPSEEFPFETETGSVEVVKFFISQQNRLHSDMYCHAEQNGKITRMNPSWPCTVFDASFVKDLKKASFYGCDVYIPQRTEEYLCLLYGEDFMEYPKHRVEDMKHFNAIKNVYNSRNV